MSDAYIHSLMLENSELLREIKEALPAKPLTSATRLQFEALSPSEKLAFIRRNGRIVDGSYSGTRVRGVGGVLV